MTAEFKRFDLKNMALTDQQKALSVTVGVAVEMLVMGLNSQARQFEAALAQRDEKIAALEAQASSTKKIRSKRMRGPMRKKRGQ
ncbi:MAG: hypothetical protein AAF903_06025 [Pseudomonadota bacterium]